MTQEDIIRMAREAGFSEQDGIITGGASDLERFAELVLVNERKPLTEKQCWEIWSKTLEEQQGNGWYQTSIALGRAFEAAYDIKEKI